MGAPDRLTDGTDVGAVEGTAPGAVADGPPDRRADADST
jgi:hypothetical protein